MNEKIVLKFVGAPVYEGLWGWPGRDLTQEDLDSRRLDKAELLAHRPRLYVEVENEESGRIQAELDELGDEFAEDGVVKTILRKRVAQELDREQIKEDRG